MNDSVDYWQPLTRAEQPSQWVGGLKENLQQATNGQPLPWQFASGDLQTSQTPNSFWVVYNFPNGGKLAIRTCFDPQTIQSVRLHKQTDTTAEYHIEGALGNFRVCVERSGEAPMLLRYTTYLTAHQDFLVQALPRDVYVLDKHGDPATTEGMVYVTQSGPTAGLAYLSVVKPAGGTVLYFQNLTALNAYCQMTHTDPNGGVAVNWPEFGFALPTAEEPVRAGVEVILSDAFLYLIETVPANEFAAADQFLEAVACIYPRLPRPDTTYYNWPKAAEDTIRALSEFPDCGRRIRGQFYLNAYVGATKKPPESMVQLAMLVPLWEYQQWADKAVPLVDQLQQNISSFYDDNQEVMMRWLPGEPFGEGETSEEEHYDLIDSWYLLHALMNLGRLAEKGNAEVRKLLLGSLEFVIRAAQRFNYNWPVFYDSRTLAILKAETSEGHGGEIDVAGLYTHVMLQAYELTKEPRYLDEAKRSAERLRGKGFELLYQANITIMSALTLTKLWRLTGNRLYVDMSRLSIANIVARFWIWDCQFGFGQVSSTFMGVSPLRDATYLAAYEEAEILATMLSYLKELGSDAPEPVRVLSAEFVKYLLHRGRYYFPAELPSDMLSEEPREGHVVPDLPIPLEDLSVGWTKAGSVGQEVYGGALAYTLATYSHTRFADVPVTIYSDYPIDWAEYSLTDKHSGYVVFQLGGTADYTCRVRLLANGRQLPNVQLIDEDNTTQKPVKPVAADKSYQEYTVQGNLRLRVDWSTAKPATK